MTPSRIEYKTTRDIDRDQVLDLYRANHWSAAQNPDTLHSALVSSHSLVSAFDRNRLVGLGNAISDGFLVVYYPHLLILPSYQGRGIGSNLVKLLMKPYQGFHQHILVADGQAIPFYQKCGFERAGQTESMWIYGGNEH